jgi:predicted transcriptional regulator
LVLPEKQRSTLRICLDIITAVKDLQNAKSTHILNKANLSHDRLVKYLDQLTVHGLIEARMEGESKYYVITPKGVQFLIEMRRADEFVAGFGLTL